ncbi:MAG TPA: glycerol kinase GlpK, partial [Bradyrhizobium sp.]|nr:glycerol kinase GlpK [Bradyrhizobium sp.]
MSFVLAIDQGTTSSRAMVFRDDISVAATAQAEFPQHFPASGWVEHDPEDIWNSTIATCREAIKKAGLAPKDIAAIGITNQRETVVVWDRASGKAIHRAIVWQDRRTSEVCAKLKSDGHEPDITAKTGLIIDPYFSGTKVAWILDHVPGARMRADRGELAFGTVDCYLLWRLSGGKVHATDATNASRTQLFNIHTGDWDDDLLKLLRVPRAMLPEVKDSSHHFGETAPELFGGAIAICGIAGDQQAATIGQACFVPGMIKSTYGTGCFALLNTGTTAIVSRNKLLTTIAYQLKGKRTYALEGSIFVAGSAVQWLRDGLGVIKQAAETGPLAEKSDSAQSVYLVPAFVGLGAPYWNPRVRGALFGLTRNTSPAELAHAALESVCYQTCDLWEAMRADWPEAKAAHVVLRVDGGMTASDWTMQRLSDL